MPGERGEPVALPGAPAVLPLVPGITRRRPPGRRPLPDAVAAAVTVRMLVIPDSAPPYDDELGAGAPADPSATRMLPKPAGQAPGRQPAAGQAPGRQPAAGQAPGRQPAAAQAPGRQPAAAQAPAGQTSQAGEPSQAGDVPGPRPTAAGSPGRSPAAPPGWPGKFAQVLAETLAGARPPRQIAPWTTDRARRHIQRLGPLLAAGEQPRVRRVVTFQPAADVVEMTVVVGVGPRVRALAVRLERDGPRRASPGRGAQAARWVCTAVEAA